MGRLRLTITWNTPTAADHFLQHPREYSGCDIEGGRRNLLPIFSDFYDCGYSSPHILNSLYMHINILKSVSNSAETNSMTSISIHALINKRLCYFSDKIAIHRQNEVSVLLINIVYFIWVVLGRARTNEI